jgi:tRNA threonylcarbamoyladenosine biosynthesis protein TsaB
MDGERVILALDSATEACSVALGYHGEIREKFDLIERGHAEHLLPMIDALMAEAGIKLADVDLFAFGAGPGSFTGLRIGAAMIQGLALATGRPVLPVSSLAALASRFRGTVLALIDARMGQVYHGLFRVTSEGIPVPLSGEAVDDPLKLSVAGAGGVIVTGGGWERYSDEVKTALKGSTAIIEVSGGYPRAADIIRLAEYGYRQGRAVQAADALPHYVRDNVAKKMDA